MTPEKYLSTAEAAKRLGVSANRVRALIRNGQLKAERLGQWAYLILEDDLKEFEANRRTKPGRPPKIAS